MFCVSNLIKEIGLEMPYVIHNEKEFDVFSRVTSLLSCPSCVFIGEKKYIKKALQQKSVSMIITNRECVDALYLEDFTSMNESNGGKGFCVTDNPKELYFKILDYVNRKHDEDNQQQTVIGKGCKISNFAHIYEHDVVIGDNVIIDDFAVIYPHTHIEDGCWIRSGAKISAQDYNYYFENGKPNHIYHGGMVRIGKNTEIGLNTCIGRALYIQNETIIGSDCKIGTNCGVGHDTHVGDRVMMYSGSLLAGNVIVEDDVRITLSCTVKNGVKIGKGAMICMGSNVLMNVKEGTKVFGNPAKKMEL